MSTTPSLAPVTPASPSALKKVWTALKAAVTSPTAVSEEKNLAVFIGTRLLLAVGASAGTIALIFEGVSVAAKAAGH